VIFTWQVIGLDELARLVVERCRPTRPAIVAVNGHSSSGKTTLAERVAARLPAAAVLHTDDLAWHQGVFAWHALLRDDVVPVVRAGKALDYRPRQWQARSRPGSITLPDSLAFLLVEGVGASQDPVRDLCDLVIWVETDEPTWLARDLPRLANGEMSRADYASWMAEENAYTTRERPWEHANVLVNGGDSIPHDRRSQAVIAGSEGLSPRAIY
jgi:hypothetical protein